MEAGHEPVQGLSLPVIRHGGGREAGAVAPGRGRGHGADGRDGVTGSCGGREPG